MEFKHEKIDLAQLRFSIILVEARPEFFEWVSAMRHKFYADVPVMQVYRESENGVYVVPDAGTFSDEDSFWKYIDSHKISFFRAELGRLMRDSEMPRDLSIAKFDELFSVKLRTSLCVLKE